MKLRNLIQESPSKAQKDKDFVCLSMLDYASVTIDQNIGGFGLKWPPI